MLLRYESPDDKERREARDLFRRRLALWLAIALAVAVEVLIIEVHRAGGWGSIMVYWK